MRDEGYIKYTAKHITASAVEMPQWAELNEARNNLYKLGLVGVYPNGIGFGNVSARFSGEEFLISGTETGVKPVLSPSDYCIVKSFDITHNHVVSSGPIQASSESMTHGAVYRSCPAANCVIHIHSKTIFDNMIRDCYPATPIAAAFGTPDIAVAIGNIVSDKGEGQIVMAGHEEGIITYGATIQRALSLILELYNKYGG